MAGYFADSWFYIALLDDADDQHRQSVRLAQRFSRDDIVTHDAIFTEVLAFFSRAGSRVRRDAADLVRRTMKQSRVNVVDRELFFRALDRYESRPDKEYSHVDCVSMIVMEDYGIQDVLTNDHHFAQAGFTVVNE